MKLNDVIYKAPEMSNEKLLELLDKNKKLIYREWFKGKYTPEQIINEWNLIQQKKSKLSKSQREQIQGLVGICLIKMTKGNE